MRDSLSYPSTSEIGSVVVKLDDGHRSARRSSENSLMETKNARMAIMLSQLERIAKSNSTALLQGESGTGKEVLARAIHSYSPRHRGPFVSVNCASLPEGVLESELFGHEKGAFTGAVRQRLGRFELATGGTLFLDEIGSADIKVQHRLLRVLQEKEFERLGGSVTVQADARVVAATNADLAAAVKEERFREDLFYRLNVLPLEVPPLRQRAEDIPLFIDHFIATGRDGVVNQAQGIEAEAVRILRAYPWPGNIRQLENTVERMIVLSSTATLTAADIPWEIVNWRDSEEAQEALTAETFWEARTHFDRRYLCEALKRHNGVISHVADAIGISRKNLYTRMQRLRIDYHRYRTR